MDTRNRGSQAEQLVVQFLTNLDWQILGQNLHYRFGEIDILGQEKDWLVIVEVKAKRSGVQGYAVEMITHAKSQTLRRLAKIVEAEYNKPVRIDIVTVDNFPHDPQIIHYPFAIEDV